MEDEYDVQQMQKTKKKKAQDSVDAEIEHRRAMLEEENRSLIAESRKRMQEGALKQKETTAELMRQGEQLHNVSENAESVYENVKKGRKLTQDIKDEGRLFKFPHIFRSIKNLFSRERRKESQLEKDIRKKKKKKHPETKVDQDVPFEDSSSDTEENMKKLLGQIRSMRKEADVQNKEMKRQELDIKHVKRLTEHSDHIMNKTNQELRKI